jgi:murein DD-endopeptidase MepM/ murein hydrolase activator NlpD
MTHVASRVADIRRRCRRIASQLVLVACALLSTSGIRVDDAAYVPPSVFAIPELAVPPASSPKLAVVPAPSITVRVVEGGVAVADADVSISDGSGGKPATARTDRDGVVRFADLEPGAYELWASRGRAASAIARVMDVAPDSRLDIILDRPATALRGRLVVDGSMPTDATVQLVPQDLDHATRITAVDREGEFELPAMPYGRWRVEAIASGHVQVTEQSVSVGAEPAEVVIRLARTGVVTGSVVDRAGAPIANAKIVLRDQAGVTAQKPVTLSASRMRWVHPLAGARVLPPNESTIFGAPRPGQRPAECGRGHCGVDLFDSRGTIVHAVADGQVVAVFAESRGEAGRLVAIHHGAGLRSLYMHLDEIRPGLEAGQPIRAGEPVGTLGSTGFVRSLPHLHFAITHDSLGRTWYLDPEPMLRTAVVLPAPRSFDPIDGSVAAATRPELAAPTVATITTDARGRFRIEGVAPGAYVAAGFATDMAPGVSAPFSVESGETASGIAIRLAPGVLVQGRVLGRDGPIAGATVIASAGIGETAHKIATATTDRHGEYSLRALAGRITLAATAPSHGEAERALAIAIGRDYQREDFKLVAEDGKLRGVVLAPDGGAAAGVSVRVVEGVTRRRTVSDALGRFTIAPVTSGRYVVELSSPEFPAKRATLDTEKLAELRLEAGGGARALIRDFHSGAPMPHVRVEASGPAGQSVARKTDARGLVELRGLAAGEWKLAVRAPGFVAASRAIAVRPGRGAVDVTIDLKRGATLAGEVRDRYGRRVAGARVSIGASSTVTDADGAFRLTGVESGRLAAEREGQRGALDLRLAPGDERLSLTIQVDD